MLGDLFLRSVQKFPENEALHVMGETFSYSELYERAVNLIRQPEFFEKHYCLISGTGGLNNFVEIIACWLSQKPYIPLNPKFSTSRTNHILAQLYGINWSQLPGLAYIIFTSGTTGIPKGVPINGDQLIRYINAFNLIVKTTLDDRVMLSYDLSFDASYLPILSAWSNGASLCVIPSDKTLMATRYVGDLAISIWHSVPSVAAMSHQAGLLDPESLPSLRYAIFGGEALSLGLVKLFQSAAPHSQVINAYGPTEATIAASYYQITPHDLLSISEDNPFLNPIPLGMPYEGVSLEIYSVDSNSLTSGIGELCIGGAQVTSGYLSSNLNKDAFFEDGGIRWYRTGDLALWDDRYGYCYKGRIDRQIKFKGYRIELQDIESALRAAANSDLVCAVPYPVLDDGSIQALVGVVAKSLSGQIEVDSVMLGLKEILPSYMVPSKILVIDDMPLSLNGKIDFKVVQEWVKVQLGPK
jgi:acyl-CoA synthetase (AMP-forming)/AMP-acid ligase II